VNPHGYRKHRDPNEKTRRRVCTFCLSTEFTQSTFLLETEDGINVTWEPKFCPSCTRTDLKHTRYSR
jgi:hypothetical protein